jgi:hypothetical protein
MEIIVDTLPNKPSELLTLALADLAKVERSKRYKVNMSNWHVPIRTDLCQVCLGGSVLAKSLNYPFNLEFKTNLVPDSVIEKVVALNRFRVGDVSRALMHLGYGADTYNAFTWLYAPEYADDKKAWRKVMRGIVRDLKKLDL